MPYKKLLNVRLRLDAKNAARPLTRRSVGKMKFILCAILIIFSCGANALKLCVAPIPEFTTGDTGARSLSNPTDQEDPYNLSVHIQQRTIRQGLSDSDCYEYPNDKNVKVVVKDHGKPAESFFVNAFEYPNGACIWFKSQYSTWSVWKLEDSKHLCVNRTEQGHKLKPQKTRFNLWRR